MTAYTVASARYLADLDASPATRRQRAWALADLTGYVTERFAPRSPSLEEVLRDDVLQAWRDRPGESGAAASVASARARASAARALTRWAVENRLVPAAAEDGLELPAAPPAIVDRTAGAQLLAVAAGPAPWGVPVAIWARFSAHVHLLAATGAPERDLALLTLDALEADSTVVRLPGHAPLALDDRTSRSVSRWLVHRAAAVASLEGSDPRTLWIRLHPGKDHRTGAIAPAGLTISARGLRLSFGTVRDALGARDPRVADVGVRDVRALGMPPQAPVSAPVSAAVGPEGEVGHGTTGPGETPPGRDGSSRTAQVR